MSLSRQCRAVSCGGHCKTHCSTRQTVKMSYSVLQQHMLCSVLQWPLQDTLQHSTHYNTTHTATHVVQCRTVSCRSDASVVQCLAVSPICDMSLAQFATSATVSCIVILHSQLSYELRTDYWKNACERREIGAAIVRHCTTLADAPNSRDTRKSQLDSRVTRSIQGHADF